MRVLYSSSAEEPYEELIAVGGMPIDFDNPESFLLPVDRTYEGWKSFLDNSQDITPIVALNYIVVSGMLDLYFPDSIIINFQDRELEIESVVHHWFEKDSNLFKYLDLTYFNLNEDAQQEIQLEGEKTKYIFDDGTSIIVNEHEVSLYQYFIPVTELITLGQHLERLKWSLLTLF